MKKFTLSMLVLVATVASGRAQTLVLNKNGAGNLNIAVQRDASISNSSNALNWNLSGNTPGANAFFTFYKFDTTGAAFGLPTGTYTLTKVEIQAAAAAELTYTATLSSGTGSVDGGTASARVIVRNLANTANVFANNALDMTQAVAANSNITSGSPYVVTSPTLNASTGVVTFTDAATLSAYSATGAVTGQHRVGARAITSVPTSGGVTGATTGFANAELTITYTYTFQAPPPTGVPEPSAVAFALISGAGLVGMMVRARRK